MSKPMRLERGTRRAEATLTERDEQALDVAKLYYCGRTQEQVARELHLSRPTVSKLLAFAKRRGFVQVVIHDPRETDESAMKLVRSAFHLLDLRVVSTVGSSPQILRESLAAAGAEAIAAVIRDGDTIGLMGSRTVSALAHRLDADVAHSVRVVELAPGLSPAHAAQLTVRMLAARLGGNGFELGRPTFYGTAAQKNAVEQEPRVHRALAAAAQCRLAVFTVGGIGDDGLLEAGLSAAEFEELVQRAVGDIGARFIDARGRVCLPDLNNRTLGISLPELRHMEQRLLVAAGPEKRAAIYATLAHGYANRLVTDFGTLEYLAARLRSRWN